MEGRGKGTDAILRDEGEKINQSPKVPGFYGTTVLVYRSLIIYCL